jgi:branched-chain amino acid transport system permease protein
MLSQLIQTAVDGLLQGCMYGLLAIGFSLVYRVAVAINLAQGAFCVLGALITLSLQQKFSMPIFAAGLLATALTMGLAYLLGLTVFVPGLQRLAPGSMFVLTAGLLTALEGVTSVVWGQQSYTLPGFSGERPISVLSLLISPQGLWLAGTTVLIAVLLAYLFARTRLGLAMRACAENPMAANLMGIGVARMQLLSFVLAAGIGALAGIVIGPITSFQFDTGRTYTILGFIAAVVGGIGSPFGALAGGLLLGVATQFAAAYGSTLFSNALVLLILLAMLLWRPEGLFAAGPARRQDVREDSRVHRSVIRIGRRTGAMLVAGGALLTLVWVPWQFGNTSTMTSLTIAAILFLAVLGLDVLMGFAGLVSLGQAGFMAIGAYTASILAVRYGVTPLSATLAGLGLSLVCALVLAFATMRLRGLYLAIATLAFGLLIDSFTVGLAGLTGGPSGLVGIPSFSIGGFVFDTQLRGYFLVMAIIGLALALLTAGTRSGFGRALLAIRADSLAAVALGIRVRRYRMAAFCISAVLGSLSGSLYAFYFHFLSPEMVGTSVSLQMLAMLVIGGEATLFGPLLGVLLITLLPVLIQGLDQYKTLCSGLLLVGASLYLPDGLVGTLLASRSNRAIGKAA